MSESVRDESQPAVEGAREGQTAAAVAVRPAPVEPQRRPEHLPPFRVLLHNDDHNDMVYVVEAILDLTPLDVERAARAMLEAHQTGVALLLVTHRERAELYAEQFASKRLRVSIEPAE